MSTGVPQPAVNHRVSERDFKYYIFDWDDNILHMPTRIHLEKRQPDGSWTPHAVSTSVFSVIRNDGANYRPPGGDWARAFAEFQDGQGEQADRFLRDTTQAIRRVLEGKEAPGPSFDTFRRTLIEGRLFAIVTARGHASETLRRGVRLFIRAVLTAGERETMMANLRGYRVCFDRVATFGSDEEELAYYLNLNLYHAVTSPDFDGRLGQAARARVNAEERKQFAIRDFVEHIVHILQRTAPGTRWRPISVGFSDDDPANVAAVEHYLRQELSRRFPSVKFVVYDTSDPALEKGRKVTVAGQLDLGI
ncbi:MAG: hypothetical protein PHR35_13675 [Kiritimatiellae bacterium]|nr:hypothetical protein [Kiritimatiellia bacterium]